MENSFTFIDLFSGIGGFHYGLKKIGGICCLASDIDPVACETYKKNFNIEPKGDIYDIASVEIPDFDLLCGGFPCQSFSNIGPKGGFADPRGAVVFEVFRILKDKKPKAFILENVKGLVNHNGGETFGIIKSELINCGYRVWYDVLEAKDYGLPQIRKRLFIVGIDERYDVEFEFPEPIGCRKKLSDVMGGKTDRDYAFTIRIGGRRSGINNKFNWDSYYVDGKPRYISVEECLELQGFSRDFVLAGNEDLKYKQVGNSVPTTIIKALGEQLQKAGVLKKTE